MSRIVVAVLLAAGVAHADCDPARVRAELAAESVRMDHWRYGWSAAYAVATAIQLGADVAQYNPFGTYDRAYRDANLVGGVQSGVSAIGMLFSPGIDVPAPTGDRCRDLEALRAARTTAGALERTVFWETHIGNLVINIAGSAVLVERTGWSAAAVAFAIGYPIGLLNTYTLPRESWHALKLGAAPLAEGGVTLRLAGTF